MDQQRRQLAVRFYSEWYCATSRLDVLAIRFCLALNRYIVWESVDINQYQVMICSDLFEETDEHRIFS